MNRWAWAFLLCTGCAAVQRDCSSCGAENFGSDWVVIQYGYDGHPINCWQLRNTAITNEDQTDGIYWQSRSGHLVHISGWYNRVQVTGGDFSGAAKQLGITLSLCSEGKYATPVTSAKTPPTAPPDAP